MPKATTMIINFGSASSGVTGNCDLEDQLTLATQWTRQGSLIVLRSHFDRLWQWNIRSRLQWLFKPNYRNFRPPFMFRVSATFSGSVIWTKSWGEHLFRQYPTVCGSTIHGGHVWWETGPNRLAEDLNFDIWPERRWARRNVPVAPVTASKCYPIYLWVPG